MRYTTPVLSTLFFVLLAVHATQVLAVRVGTEGGGHMKSIFMLTYLSGLQPPYPDHVGVATAANVKYQRCLVTARHVGSGLNSAVMGDDLRTITDNDKRQDVESWNVSPGIVLDKPWTDFAVLWMKNLQDSPTGVKRIQAGRDYTPLSLAKAETAGLTPIPYPGLTGSGVYNQSPGAPKTIDLEGYGMNATDGGGNDVGASVRRTGAPEAIAFYSGTSALLTNYGSAFRVHDRAANGYKIGCDGDSGSPLLLGDAVLGVLSRGRYPHCANEEMSDYAAFDNINPWPGTTETNWTRLNALIGKNCVKQLSMSVSGQGSIAGSFTPQWIDPDGDYSYNGSINCDDNSVPDCYEYMHEGDSITLTATPAAGWVFKEWGTDSSACPCNQSTNSTCSISYDQMGTYTAEVSSDAAYCEAFFEQQGSSSSAISSVASSAASSAASSFSSI